jgi:hypothetical protein
MNKLNDWKEMAMQRINQRFHTACAQFINVLSDARWALDQLVFARGGLDRRMPVLARINRKPAPTPNPIPHPKTKGYHES